MNRTPRAYDISPSRRSLAAFGLSAALAGCGVDDEFRSAIPDEPLVTIALPGAAPSSSPRGVDDRGSARGDDDGALRQALVGETAEFYQHTYSITTSINGGIGSAVRMMRELSMHPPTTRTATSRIYGPFTPGGLEPLTFRAQITRVGPGQFTYEIAGRRREDPADAPFLPLLEGRHVARDENGGLGAESGKGTLTVRWDNSRRLVPTACESGRLTANYDGTTVPSILQVAFSGVGSENPLNPTCKRESPRDAAYHYTRDRDGGGDFLFEMHGDMHKAEEKRPLKENLLIRSRWRGDGAGRSDVRIGGGEVPADLKSQGSPESSVHGAQCWGADFRTVYQTSTPLGFLPTGGAPLVCALGEGLLP